MRWKTVLIGGSVYFVAVFILQMLGGIVIHSEHGVLDPLYRATEEFWRPELNQKPPDMAGLMPHWILAGLVQALIVAGIYGCVRSSFGGPAWRRGAVYGICLAFINLGTMLALSGVFNLPMKLWGWWIGEGFLYYVAGGAVLGLISEKVDPERH